MRKRTETCESASNRENRDQERGSRQRRGEARSRDGGAWGNRVFSKRKIQEGKIQDFIGMKLKAEKELKLKLSPLGPTVVAAAAEEHSTPHRVFSSFS